MPEPVRSTKTLEALLKAMLKCLKDNGEITWKYFQVPENKARVKKNANLLTDQHVAAADWEHLYDKLYEIPGVAIRGGRGNGIKNRVYVWTAKEMLGMDMPIITKPSPENRQKMVEAMETVLNKFYKQHPAERHLTVQELRDKAAVEAGFTLSLLPIQNWGIVSNMARARGITVDDAGIVYYDPDHQKKKAEAKKRRADKKGGKRKKTQSPTSEVTSPKAPAQPKVTPAPTAGSDYTLMAGPIEIKSLNGVLHIQSLDGRPLQISSDTITMLMTVPDLKVSVSS